MRVLVTGTTGQLGYDVCEELAARGVEHMGVGSKEMDLTDPTGVRDRVMAYRPDAVIHCAAYTAVDKAEDEPELCRAVNVEGTRALAACCRISGSKMLYVSTDYVFSGTGNRAFEVDDPKGPLSVYGTSKLDGELVVQGAVEKYFIVRVSWTFGKNGHNFVKTMLRLAETRDEVGVVADQFGSPTYTADLAPLLCDMIETEKYGVYHATNEEVCSWAEFAEEIFRLTGKQVKVNRLDTKDYPAKAARPLNSRLSKASLDRAGFSRLPSWRDALGRYLQELGLR